MTAAELQQRFQKQYVTADWLDTLRQILPRTEIFAKPQKVIIENARAESILQLGKIPLAGDRNLAVLEATVDDRIDLFRNRVGLRNLVARYIDQAEYHGVLAIFHQRDAKDYRFTFAARETALTGSGELVRTETLPRRYTYLLGPNESCRTAAERFDFLARRGDRAELKDVVEAFNVEKLNKEFFDSFRKTFGVVVKDILDRNAGWERADAERETQTLLSRLLFLYFIQRKGWLNRQRDYLISAFNRQYAGAPDGITFYDQFLRPFFVKLSNDEAYFPNLDLGDLPFLNGGLFDDEIGSLTERGRMKVGNPVLRHVFDHLLGAYNFTVREDTPLDQEVAIDPEMLGKIFESLVLQLEQSDTGGKTSRHDTGSYYTPRPIVHYLCREGLRAWLEQFPPLSVGRASPRAESGAIQKVTAREDARPTKENNWPARLEKLFALDASDGIDDAGRATLNEILTPDEARALLDRLDDFRACDPAVGSGAFLVGLLHELVNLRRLCETRSRGKDPAADLEWLYETKKRVIENILYGVDLQQRAVEICKLRLWISLMVDYPLEVDPDNCALPDFRKALRKITPLPNLDFKIRRANSLIEQIRGHAVKFPQTAADSRDFNLSLNRLAAAKHRFYEARRKKDKRQSQLDILDATAELAQYEFSAAKLKYGLLPSDKDAERVAELAAAEAEMGKLQMQIAVARKKGERDKDDDIERLSRVFNDEAKPTFVWQLDFAEIFHRNVGQASRLSLNLLEFGDRRDACPTTSGFDLVLANPPYVRQEKIKELKPFLQNAYDCYTGTADLYVYFYERALKLLGHGGVLSFISSNKFFRAGYGEKLRNFLREKTELQTVIDFGDLPIFEATAYPCIIVASNREPRSERSVRTLNVRTSEQLDRFGEIVATLTTPIPQKDFGETSWQLVSSLSSRLLEKIRNAGQPLGGYVKNRFYRGVVTGFNSAFILDSATRNALIAEDKSSKDVLKPFTRGRDVKRWCIEPKELWLIFTRRGIDIEKFPAIKKHLAQFKKQLVPGAPGGRKPGPYEWYEIQDSTAYWPEFGLRKILYPDIAKNCEFALDTSDAFPDCTLFLIPEGSAFLLGVLNSTVISYFFPLICPKIRGDYMRFKSIYMEQIPIPTATAAERSAIEGLVEQCLAARGENCGAWETEINARVARLYGLTPDEIKLVEEATRK
jgi:type I restriction-modification system DNA methylase subunit